MNIDKDDIMKIVRLENSTPSKAKNSYLLSLSSNPQNDHKNEFLVPTFIKRTPMTMGVHPLPTKLAQATKDDQK